MEKAAASQGKSAWDIAAFYTAERLFGLGFVPRPDIAGYHPDVRVWEVQRNGRPIGIFYGDYFARPGKRSGAWMTSFREQSKLDGAVLPLVIDDKLRAAQQAERPHAESPQEFGGVHGRSPRSAP